MSRILPRLWVRMWWVLLVGVVVFGMGVGWASDSGEISTSTFSEADVPSRFGVSSAGRGGMVGQSADSCWVNFGALPRAGNVRVTSTTESAGVEELPTVFFVAGSHSVHNRQYLVKYLEGEDVNCGELGSLSVTPDLPGELVLESDGEGISLYLQEFVSPIPGMQDRVDAGVVPVTPEATYTVSASDLDDGMATFEFDLEVVADQVYGSHNDPGPTFSGALMRPWVSSGGNVLDDQGDPTGAFHWKKDATISPLFRTSRFSPGNEPHSYEWDSGVTPPAGVVIDAATGVISGSPSEVVDARALTVKITDWDGNSTISNPFTVTVSEGGLPKTTHLAPRLRRVGGPDSAQISTTDTPLILYDRANLEMFVPRVVDLLDWWEDPDSNNDMTFSAEVVDADSSGLEVSVSGRMLTLEASKATSDGLVDITAWGNDDVPQAPHTVRFSFDVEDRPPVVVSQIVPNPLLLPAGGSRTFARTYLDGGVFRDYDGALFGFFASSDDTSVVTAGSVNDDLDVKITVADDASDGDSAVVTIRLRGEGVSDVSVMLTVRADANAPAPPVISDTIGNIDLEPSGESWASRSWDLYDHFSDSDSDTIDFTVTSAKTEHLTAAIVESVDGNGDPVATLTLEGVSKGSSAVEVIATDADNAATGSVRFGWIVRVLDRPPVKTADPAMVSISPGGNSQVQLANVFSDPDGEAMTFTVEKESGGSDELSASVSGGVLTVVASSAASIGDMATFTVKPQTEQVGQTITHDVPATVSVSVVDPNTQLPPVVKASPNDSIPDQPITVSNREFVDVTLDLDTYFEDPNDDAITYSASSDDSSVATVSVSGSMLTISGVSPGMTVVTVTASDAATGASLPINVTVPDRAPYKVSDPGPVNIAVGGMRMVSLVSHFNDPDGETISFEGSTSDSTVAIVAPGDGQVTITVRDDATVGNTATITVNPTGHRTLTATIAVTVTGSTTNPPNVLPTLPPNLGGGGGGGGGTGGGAPPVVQPPADQPSVGMGFSDSVGTTHEVNINRLAESGITRGCNPPTNSMFCPDRAVTRGEMATFMVRSFDLASSGSDLFADDDGNTHEANINALATAEITRGCNPPENTRYCPDRPVTRAQMATFLARAMELEEGSGGFEDTAGSPHANDINRIASVGITRGCNPPENSRFCPDRAVTRGEMATFLIRAEDIGSS